MNRGVRNISPRVAVVEDDGDLRATMLEYLAAQGYSVWGASSAEEFFRRSAVDAVDVVVLDVGLPGEDGLSVARHLREAPDLAVVIVSARDALEDRLAGMKAGADRYLVKPVDLAELVVNIEAADRRLAHPHGIAATGQIPEEGAQAGIWRLRKSGWRLTEPGGKDFALTAREFLLLKLLIEANGETVPKKTIADSIVGPRVFNSYERLDVMLARLRKKCAAAIGQTLPVQTVHQTGYAFTAPAATV